MLGLPLFSGRPNRASSHFSESHSCLCVLSFTLPTITLSNFLSRPVPVRPRRNVRAISAAVIPKSSQPEGSRFVLFMCACAFPNSFQLCFHCVVSFFALLSYVSEHVCRLASNTSQHIYQSMNRRVHLFVTRTRFLLVVYNRLIWFSKCFATI